MSILQAIILGIIQGLTEFLPISSSAHLVLAPYFLNWHFPVEQIFPFDVIVQLGTLLAVIIYFHQDLWAILKHFARGIIHLKPFETSEARMGWFLILATIPAGVVGLLIKKQVEAAFNSPLATGLFLLVTAAFLLLADWLGKRTRSSEDINWLDALVAGLFQAVAIFPGISRSGSTIAGGMLRGLDRPTAARFSFLMSVPVMLAAGLLSILDLRSMPGLGSFLLPLGLGFAAAALVGYFSIRWLIGFLGKHSLRGFAFYCIAVAVLTVGFWFFIDPQAGEASAVTYPQTYQVQLSSSLHWLGPYLNTCMLQRPQAGIIVHEVPSAQFDPQFTGISLRWGAPAEFSGRSYQLGSDSIVVIANPSNPATGLSYGQMVQIFNGQKKDWKVWTIPDGDDSLKIFEKDLLGTALTNPAALIAPDSAAVVSAVSSDPQAIGFVPNRMVNSSVKVLPISAGNSTPPAEPVLATLPGQPDGFQQAWLYCLQSALGGH
jgi:undecaprenyl-diphosphatase